MAKYTITNQKELRRSFWVFCKEFGGEFEREANKKKLLIISYVLFNAAFIRCRGVYLWHRSQKIKRLHK